MVTAFWNTRDPNYGSLSWFWRCKEHSSPLSPNFGVWRMLEVANLAFESWSWIGWVKEPCLDLPWSFHFNQISRSWDFTVLILDWLYLSFHWSESDQNFMEDPREVPHHIPIKIKMPNPSQEPPASSKAPNEDLKDMYVLCTFKAKIESQNLEHGHTKDQWPYPNQYQDARPHSRTSRLF